MTAKSLLEKRITLTKIFTTPVVSDFLKKQLTTKDQLNATIHTRSCLRLSELSISFNRHKWTVAASHHFDESWFMDKWARPSIKDKQSPSLRLEFRTMSG